MACVDVICITTGKTSSDISYDHGISWQAFDDLTAQKNDRGFYTLAASDNHLIVHTEAGTTRPLLMCPKKHRHNNYR